MKTVVLGPEYEEGLGSAVMAAVREMGGKVIDRIAGVAGSQDVQIVKVGVAGQVIVITAETYMGLSVEGPDALVDKVASAVRAGLTAKKSTRRYG